MIKLFVFVALISYALCVPVDNGVEGEPEIECGPAGITANFNTQNPFEGHVYVKGLYNDENCRDEGEGRQIAGITLGFDECNVRRFRSLNPKGVFVQTTIIVSFHPDFITKVDRAYTIQCFYMEADKTVDTGLEVSMLTTDFKTSQVVMPVCRYEILDGSPTGAPVEYGIVGQQVYHKWTCDSEAVDTFCMIVHSCFVDDTNGDRVQLVDENGCAADLYLLNNPEYTSNLMAGVEAHIFKYADRADLYFQCQITILVKEPGQDCPRPACPIPGGRGAGSANPQPGPIAVHAEHPYPLQPGSPYLPQNRRRFARNAIGPVAAGTLDVGSHIGALDIDERNAILPNNLAHRTPNFFSNPSRPVVIQNEEGVCLSSTTFFAVITLGALLVAGVIGISTYLMLRRSKD